jgi:hypothetical protein
VIEIITPQGTLKKMGELGFRKLRHKYGGMVWMMISLRSSMEELSKIDASASVIVG